MRRLAAAGIAGMIWLSATDLHKHALRLTAIMIMMRRPTPIIRTALAKGIRIAMGCATICLARSLKSVNRTSR